VSLTSAHPFEEGKAVAVSSAEVWFVRCKCIQPLLRIALFEKLVDGLPGLGATLALDLTDNYLGTLS